MRLDGKISRILGMKAVEEGFISEKQLIKCLNHIEFVAPGKTLEEAFIELGCLTSAQVQRLKGKVTMMWETPLGAGEEQEPDKKCFGSVAIERNLVDHYQLDEALEEQKAHLEFGVRVQIGQILLKKGYLTIAQIKMILDELGNRVLYCKRCKKTKMVSNYDPLQLFQCECGFDLVEMKHEEEKKIVKKQTTKIFKKQEEEYGFDDGGEDDDIGGLTVLEL